MVNISSLQSFLSANFLGFNWLDVSILVIVGFYAFEGYKVGFILAFLDFASFILSFVVAITGYSFLAKVLVNIFALPIGFANAIGFFVVALLVEIIVNILFRQFVYKHLIPLPGKSRLFDRFRRMDHVLGIVPGSISAVVLIAFLLTLVVTLPSSPLLKLLVTNSRFGSFLIGNTAAFEGQLNEVFGGAFHETMNFLTVEPKSNETIKLHFTVANGTVDEQAEVQMLRMVNKERQSRGIPALQTDPQLIAVARAHAQDMFSRGYFSHYTPTGLSPFDRMQQAGISYTSAGENLALAPNVELAMQGLMNSPGHKANILSPSFHKVGIGVIDGGIYGEMFSQEFTN